MIKVALDNSVLSAGHKTRGVGFYTQGLIEAFKNIKIKDVEVEPINFYRKQQSELTGYDLIHFPFFDPFFLTLPIRKILPIIITIHDLIPIKFPQYFPKGIKGWLKWQIQKYSLVGVKAIITDSDSSKEDIKKIIGFPDQKIHRIYLAANQQFKISPNSISKKIIRKYSLPEKFILYVGDVNWNKNILGLIKSFARLQPQKTNIYLVIVGKAFLNKEVKETQDIIQLIKQLNLSNKIRFLGWVPTEDLVVLYNKAICYCQPSFYEGFGLPVLEAMSCGCPIVCSNKSSLPEITGKGALLVNPYNYEAISQAIEKIIEDEQLRHKLIKEGLKQAEKFSWTKTAQQTLAVYQNTINEN